MRPIVILTILLAASVGGPASAGTGLVGKVKKAFAKKDGPGLQRQTEPDMVPTPIPAVLPARCTEEGWVKSGKRHPYAFTLKRLPPGQNPGQKRWHVGKKIDGVKHGPYLEYSGNRLQKRTKKTAPYRYLASGYHQGTHDRGQRSGEERHYAKGFLLQLAHYREGRQHGAFVTYDRCKNEVQRTEWKEGKLSGVQLQFHENGLKKSESEYREGRAVGAHRSWFQHGRPLREVLHDDAGNRISLVEWSQTGVKTLEQQGERKTTRFPSGYLESQIIPATADTRGTKQAWYENGQPMLSAEFDAEGKVVGRIRHWREDGSEITNAEWRKLARKEKNKKRMKAVGEILLLPVEILLLGLK